MLKCLKLYHVLAVKMALVADTALNHHSLTHSLTLHLRTEVLPLILIEEGRDDGFPSPGPRSICSTLYVAPDLNGQAPGREVANHL